MYNHFKLVVVIALVMFSHPVLMIYSSLIFLEPTTQVKSSTMCRKNARLNLGKKTHSLFSA